jgi:hypothetical protein
MSFPKKHVPWNRTESNVICKYCNKSFHIAPSRLTDTRIKRGNYCSKQCADKAREGKPAWNSGLTGEDYKKHYPKGFGGTFFATERLFGGSIKEYMALHHWLRKILGRPTQCVNCKKSYTGKNIQWANKSGEYKKDVNDWIRLCVKCHYIYDNHAARRKIKKLESIS